MMGPSTGGTPGRKPLASVVVNNHNYARFLGHAIDSALAQTYAPIEVLVVDDGSTDASRDVIASYGDKLIPIFKENGGQASAFNAGFAESRGEVVLFLDADDGPLGGEAPPTSGNAWSRRFLERVLPMPEQKFPINSDGYLVTLAWIYGVVRAVKEPLALYRGHGRNQFVSKPPALKRRRQREMYIRRCVALAQHLKAMNVPADVKEWRTRGPYQWEEHLRGAKRELADLIPAGSRFILVDEEEWGDESGDWSGVMPGLFAVPYLERNGLYDGRPTDGTSAIANLERLRKEEARYIVFTWTTKWWLDEFGEVSHYLRAHYRCIPTTDLVVVFDLG
jgi:Glycosyl transferase family 2